MICPNCSHTMADGLTYCECCGTYLAAPQPRVRVVSASTYRVDVYDQCNQPEGSAYAPSAPQGTAMSQGTTMYYNLYDSANQQLPNNAPTPQYSTVCASARPVRQQRRSRKMRTLFSASLLSVLLLGFGGGMTAFATDDADNRMPLVVEYEEVFSAEPAEPAFEAEDVNEATIPEEGTPMPAPSFVNDDVAPVEPSPTEAPEYASSPEQTNLAGAPTDDQPIGILAEVSLSPCMLDINGTRVPYVRSLFAPSCPNNNAALWAGDDSTTDGSFGYFVGHNPGDFSCVYALTEGDRVTLCNAKGDIRDYTVTRIFVVPNTTYFEQLGTDVVPQSESVVLQTCIGDGSYYRIVVCE